MNDIGLEHRAAFAEKGWSQAFACGQVRRGQRLEGVGVSNGDEVCSTNLWHDRDVCTEIKMNRQQDEFI